MKKNIVYALAVIASTVAVAGTSNVAKAPPGTDNISFGYGAGAGTAGDNVNAVCIGTDSGLNSANCTNTVFIGSRAGNAATNASGIVVIKADPSAADTNAALYVSATEAKINGKSVVTGPVVTSVNGHTGAVTMPIVDKISVTAITNAAGQAFITEDTTGIVINDSMTVSGKTAMFTDLKASYETSSGTTVYKVGEDLALVLYRTQYYIGLDENSVLCLYNSRGDKVGTIAYTPEQ